MSALLKWPDACLRMLTARTVFAWAVPDGTDCLQHGNSASGLPEAPVKAEWSCLSLHCWHVGRERDLVAWPHCILRGD